MIFDTKMEDFRCKARLVAGSHVTKPPANITYDFFVYMETVRIALTVVSLDVLQAKKIDIQNDYIQEPVVENIWTVLGPEFGIDAGKPAVVVIYLYEIKRAGSSFWKKLYYCMKHIDYMPCPADPDLCMNPMVRPSDGAEYYAYILLYANDILCIHQNTESFLIKVDKYFKLKPDSIGDPDMYLESKVRPTKLDNGVWAWALSPSQDIQEILRKIQNDANKNTGGRWKFPSTKHAPNPFEMVYSPGLDSSPVIDPLLASYYQSQIGVLR